MTFTVWGKIGFPAVLDMDFDAESDPDFHAGRRIGIFDSIFEYESCQKQFDKDITSPLDTAVRVVAFHSILSGWLDHGQTIWMS